MDLKFASITGIKWTSLSRISKQALQFITLIILANLLSPSDFGLMGMAMVVIGFLNVFRDLGISAALIQKEEVSKELFSSVFWINSILGLLITVIVFFLSPLIADFYNDNRLTFILKILSFGFLISSITILHQAILERNLLFNKIAKIEIIATLCGSLLGIILAVLNFGVWSLVFQSLTTIFVSSLFLWLISAMKPRFIFNWKDIKSVAKFSLNLSGFNIVNYFVRNADYLIIGKYLGAQELGLYTLAYRIMLYPLENITSVVSRVLFPIYSKIKNDNKKFRQIFTKVANAIALLTFPMMLGMMLVSKYFVHIFFEPKWYPVVTLLIIFSPIGLIQSVYTTAGSIYQAKARTDLWFYWGIFTAIIFVSAFFIGLNWGIIGVAISYLFANFITIYPGLKIPFRLIDLKVNDFFSSFNKIAISCFFMVITSILFIIIFSDYISDFGMFIIIILIGASSYIFVNIKINKKNIMELLDLIRNKKD